MAYTLTNLRDDVRNYTEVSSTVLTDAILDTMIKNAENKIYRSSDNDDNRFYATSTLQTGNRYVTIPSDLRVIRYVQLKDSAGNQVYLEQRDPSYIATYYDTPGTASSTLPKYYANWDENYWVIAPTPNAAYEITLAYNKNPVSLTDATKSTTGTYLSNKYQDLILYASLVNAYAYLKGPQDMLQYYGAAYKEALETYATEQIGRRRRNEYQDGVIRLPIKSESPSSY